MSNPAPGQIRGLLLAPDPLPMSQRDDAAATLEPIFEGVPGAFERFKESVQPTIERCLRRALARNKHLTLCREDLLQSLDLHLVSQDYRVLRSFRGNAKLTTWIHAVASRHFYGQIKRAPQRELPHAQLELSGGPTPEEQALEADQRALVRRTVADLNDEDKVLVGLLFEQNVTAMKASRLLGLKPSAVRMRKKRLLERLKDKLKEAWP